MSESLTDPGLVHLARPTDDTSIFEHARGAIERREHGYCSDDAGRALIAAVRSADPRAFGLVERYLGFLAHMYLGEGWFALRMGFDRTLDGRWALIHRRHRRHRTALRTSRCRGAPTSTHPCRNGEPLQRPGLDPRSG